MKLKQLKLENFRQHVNSNIRFEDGMTAIVGPNGSGKTTILEAITYALYGKQRNKRATLRFFWAQPRTKCRVTLDFEFDGRTYILSRGENEASLEDVTEDATTIASGISAVDRKIAGLLRLNYEQFKNSFCAEQKHLSFLQFNADSKRQEQVARMLGLDRLRAASDRARTLTSQYRAQISTLESTLGDPDQLASSLLNAKEDVKAAQAAVLQAERVLDLSKAALPSSERASKSAEEWLKWTKTADEELRSADDLKGGLRYCTEAFDKAVERTKRRLEIQNSADKFSRLEQEAKALDQAKSAYQLYRRDAQLAERLRTEIKEDEENLSVRRKGTLEELRRLHTLAEDEATLALKLLEESRETWTKKRHKASNAEAKAKADRKHAEDALLRADVLIAQGKCPQCGQATSGDFVKSRTLLEEGVASAKTALEEAVALRVQTDVKAAEVEVAESRAAKAHQDLKLTSQALQQGEIEAAKEHTIRTELDKKSRRLAELERKLDATQVNYDAARHQQLETDLEGLAKVYKEFLSLANAEDELAAAAKSLDEAKNKIEVARTRYRTALEERKKLPFESSEQANEAIASLRDLKAKIREQDLDLNHGRERVKMAAKILQSQEEKLETYRQNELRVRELKQLAQLNTVASKELLNLRQILNTNILPELEARASENLALLTNNRYPRLQLDEDFEATVMEDDDTPKAVISGGEEDVVALALRLALSELIQERQGRPMSLLILDEVFGSLDQERRQAVLERLRAIKGRFDQILVISHIEEINHVADHSITLSIDPERHCTVVGEAPISQIPLLI